ncbi:hypothetical protein [Faecalibaculum rodentium]|uniref:hypothetical protein n=1 Tax=Faecalibaculum rodentium TaxID=1702221 RepID=UPI0023F4199C|nr:hypothetical protein [Faecalibaculum rodentium]
MFEDLFEIDKIELDSVKFVGDMANISIPQKLAVIRMWNGWKTKNGQSKSNQPVSFFLDGKIYSIDDLDAAAVNGSTEEEKQPEQAEVDNMDQSGIKLDPMLMQIIYDVYPLIRKGKLDDGVVKQLIVHDSKPARGIYKKNGRYYWTEPGSREFEFVSPAAARLFCLSGHKDPEKGNSLENLDRQEVLIPQLRDLKKAMSKTKFSEALQFLMQQLGIESPSAPEAGQTGLSDILAGG